MFDAVGEKYDITNTVLSFGQDRRWRKLTRKRLNLQPGEKVTVHLVSARGREPFYHGLGFAPVPDAGCGAGMRRTLLGPDR